MEIDYNELKEQIKEDILKTGEYARADIIIPRINNSKDFKDCTPAVSVELKKIGCLEIALLIHSIDLIKEELIEKVKKLGKLEELYESIKFVKDHTEAKTLEREDKEDKTEKKENE